jgi:hypothetical protein
MGAFTPPNVTDVTLGCTTGVGTSFSVLLPSPNCPKTFEPQAYVFSSDPTATVW